MRRARNCHQTPQVHPTPLLGLLLAVREAASYKPAPPEAVGAASDGLWSNNATVPAQNKSCWFLHGSGCPDDSNSKPCPTPSGADRRPGIDRAGEGRPTASLRGYWGKVHEIALAHGCASTHFNHEQTTDQLFDEPRIRERTCRELCGSPGCVITDKVIFTHSAGNLYFAAALDHGDCFLGASSEWFTSQSPTRGSAAADAAAHLCDYKKGNPLRAAVNFFGYCQDQANQPTRVRRMYGSLMTDYLYMDAKGVKAEMGSAAPLQNVMTAHVSGGLCGDKPDGFRCTGGSKLAPCKTCHGNFMPDKELCAVAKVAFPIGTHGHFSPTGALSCCVGHGVLPCDGMVALDSCELPSRRYDDSAPTNPWYRLHGNHADGTCRNGDQDPSSGGKGAAQPCQWYGSMVQRSTTIAKRTQRYACVAGQKACGVHPEGNFTSEAQCVRHCAVCEVPSNPCLHGGVCSAQSNSSWNATEADHGRGFGCSCPEAYTGDRCELPVPPPESEPEAAGWVDSTQGRAVLIGGGGGVALLVVLGGLAMRRRRRGVPAAEHPLLSNRAIYKA
eukprot:COSAG01_NODE_1070_length_11869_cov_21.371368_11_plen_557_part_00